MRCWRVGSVGVAVIVLAIAETIVPAEPPSQLVEQLASLAADIYPPDSDSAKQLRQAWPNLLREGIRQANERSTREWKGITTREDWQRFRQQKLAALRQALRIPEEPPKPGKVQVTGQLRGQGYRIENLLYESRPGLWVSANLYLPEQPSSAPAGLLIVHSHHTPKWHAELQDMGIVWARAGAAVLIPDLLGHGERRLHPFVDEKSYPAPFRPSRQDYYFRYNSAAQLYLLGETLMGWMVHDLRCGIGVLLEHAQADPKRIGILGSVAGGGDVAAVTAATDERIRAAVVFNFGGPEPEDPFPLPQDAEQRFNYAGSGSWESTRNVLCSARDGFLPWVIVASIAPRGLCYAHEFSWDRERDPVWKRLQQVWKWYGAEDRLRFAHGQGVLTGKPPENTHCTHIGAVHRQAGVYQALQAWFGLPIPERENNVRHGVSELTCWTADARQALRPLPWEQWLPNWWRQQAQGSVESSAEFPDAATLWKHWLDNHRPSGRSTIQAQPSRRASLPKAEALWYILRNLDGMEIPVLLLVPERRHCNPPSVVVFCSQGKARFLRERAQAVASLLERGIAVCLADVRDAGETATSPPGRNTASTAHAATALMLGVSVEELRLYDALAVVRWLRGVGDSSDGAKAPILSQRLAIWGDTLAPTNPADAPLAVPWDAPRLPQFADPGGPRLALYLAATLPDVRAVYAAGDLAQYAHALESPFLYLPLTAIRPGALRPYRSAGGPASPLALHSTDTPQLLARARTVVLLEGLVNAKNQAVNREVLNSIFAAVLAQRKTPSLQVHAQRRDPRAIADWLAEQLTR